MHVWVIEMWNEARLRWEPCAAGSLTRDESRLRRALWSRRNPSDRFRLRKYVPADLRKYVPADERDGE